MSDSLYYRQILLDQVLPDVLLKLKSFAESDRFDSDTKFVFGNETNIEALSNLRQLWINGDFSGLPTIEIVDASTIDGNNAAYASATNKIYFSDSFLNRSLSSPQTLIQVMTEEIGHYVDTVINTKDTLGDEGELFSRVVWELDLSPEIVNGIRGENDRIYGFNNTSLETNTIIGPVILHPFPGAEETNSYNYNFSSTFSAIVESRPKTSVFTVNGILSTESVDLSGFLHLNSNTDGYKTSIDQIKVYNPTYGSPPDNLGGLTASLREGFLKKAQEKFEDQWSQLSGKTPPPSNINSPEAAIWAEENGYKGEYDAFKFIRNGLTSLGLLGAALMPFDPSEVARFVEKYASVELKNFSQWLLEKSSKTDLEEALGQYFSYQPFPGFTYPDKPVLVNDQWSGRLLDSLKGSGSAIIIPHSQGNFFVEDLLRSLLNQDSSFTDALNKLQVLALGSPTRYSSIADLKIEIVNRDAELEKESIKELQDAFKSFSEGKPVDGIINFVQGLLNAFKQGDKIADLITTLQLPSSLTDQENIEVQKLKHLLEVIPKIRDAVSLIEAGLGGILHDLNKQYLNDELKQKVAQYFSALNPTGYVFPYGSQNARRPEILWTGDVIYLPSATQYGDWLIGGWDSFLDWNTINGQDGNDVLRGQGGRDILIGGRGYDVLDGGSDFDTADYQSSDNNIVVRQKQIAGSDVYEIQDGYGQIDFAIDIEKFIGSRHDDKMYGGRGADEFEGKDGNDYFEGGGSGDKFWGGKGQDTAYGGTGSDELWGEDDKDTLYGGAGNDKLHGGWRLPWNPPEDSLNPDGFNSPDNPVVTIAYQPGMILEANNTRLPDLADALYGEDGDDYLDGDAGDDYLDGGNGNDFVLGGDGNDLVFGGAGQDRLNGEDGNDIIYGGDGNDIMGGQQGDDLMTGDDGDDTMYGQDGNDNLEGGEGSDAISGGSGSDQIFGGNGNDTASGGQGDDVIYGEGGNDELSGNEGVDRIEGGIGDDKLFGGNGNDTLLGQDGNDELYGQNGDDYLEGGAGGDLLDGGEGKDLISYRNAKSGVSMSLKAGGWGGEAAGDRSANNEGLEGSNYDDYLIGDDGANTLSGLKGNDILEGYAGDDELDGSDGNDRIVGGLGNDTQIGGLGDDTHYAELGNDTVIDLAGNNYIDLGEGDNLATAGDGNDTIVAGPGNDRIDAGNGNNIVRVGEGHNWIITGLGNDVIYDGAGNDSVFTGAGNDIIYLAEGRNFVDAGIGNNTIYSGSASDLFVLTPGEGASTIIQFQVNDRFGLVGGISYDDLLINPGRGNQGFFSQISLASTGDLLGIVNWVQPNLLTRDLFVQVDYPGVTAPIALGSSDVQSLSASAGRTSNWIPGLTTQDQGLYVPATGDLNRQLIGNSSIFG
jgi:Ca2+-binding RTX toxin-like protein